MQLDVSEQKRIFTFRLNMVEKMLRACNSATDVHEVANLRNLCELVRLLIAEGEWDGDKVRLKLEELEDKQLEFFKRKFTTLKSSWTTEQNLKKHPKPLHNHNPKST